MTDIASDIGLEYVVSRDGRLRPPLDVGGPYGRRTVFDIIDGRVRGDGDGAGGSVRSGGADWMLIGADGWARPDVRARLRLDDGTHRYVIVLGRQLRLAERQAHEPLVTRKESRTHGTPDHSDASPTTMTVASCS